MSEIERYLDELSDRMGGQGAAGRRALAEAEDHLRAAAADAVARGLSAEQAEADAVARFGAPAVVARAMRPAAGGGRLGRVVSAAWLLAGLAAAGFGVAYLAASGRLGWQSPAWTCREFLSPDCYYIGQPAVRDLQGVVIAAAGGTALLMGWRLAVRYGGLAPVRRGFALAAGLVVGISAFAFGMSGQAPVLPVGWFTGVLAAPQHVPAVVGAAVLMECLAAAVSLGASRSRWHQA